MILYCIRHGFAEHNAKNIMNGDPTKPYNLTELGKKQAQKAAEKLKSISFNIIITSELLRCKKTAEIINKFHNLPIKIEKRLNDLKSGVEGQAVQIYKEEREKRAKEQKIDIYNVRLNDGESFEDEKKRVGDFLDYLKKQKYEKVLIVSHQDIIKAIYGYVKKLDNEKIKEFKPKQCEIFKFELK